METLKSTCISRVLCHITIVSATPVVFFISLYIAKLHSIFLALLPTLLVYPPYLSFVKKRKLLEASILVLEWAFMLSLAMIAATLLYGEGIGNLVIRGEAYKEEMFLWIKTGYGPEGDPSLFMAPKIKEIIIFSLAGFISVGFLALLMGGILLNYMNYYVGSLLLHANPGAFFTIALLAWPIYAILRVPGYIFLGTVLTRISYVLIKKRKLMLEPEAKKLLYYAFILIILDFVLKGTIA
ncbi:MAG: hypothetical protein DRJ35_07780, partial [Thermoprotei archaeon]